MTDPVLEVRHVVSRIGVADILRDVSLVVGAGEAVCLLGPNGAGKTTLLRTVSGLVEVRSGAVSVEGRDIGRVPPWDRVALGVAHVPQDRRCFGALTVLENLRMGAYLRPRDSDARSAEVMELFPVLYEKRDAKARELSGGQQQMLAIGRALMSEPKILLLDEPTLGLAPSFVHGLRELLAGMAQERKVAMLLVEQNVRLAMAVAERVYVLRGGQMVISGEESSEVSETRLADAYLGING